MPPLGIANLAAVARRAGHEVRILDCEALQLTTVQSAKIILAWKPDYIGLSATTLGIFAAARVARIIKENQRSIKIIVGGPHITSIPEKTMHLFPQFDIGVTGEGEETILDLIDALENNRNLTNVCGLALRDGKDIIRTERRKYIKNLDDLPFPAYDLFPNLTEVYRPPVFGMYRNPTMSVVLTRGCPAECSFCDRSVFGKVSRVHSVNYILRMWEELHFKYGIKDIMIHDDTLTAFRKLLFELCKKLKERNLNIRWTCNGRVDQMTPDLLKAMKEGGCWEIAYGIESGSQRILDYMKKNIRLQQVKQAIKWTKMANIRSRGFFIFGYPTETKEDIEATIEFMLQLDLDDVHISLFTPFPNTAAYFQALNNGHLNDDWEKMSQWHHVFKPYGLEDGDLGRYLKKAVRNFYLRPRIIGSYFSLIKEPKHIKSLYSGAKAFFKLMIKNT